MMVIASILLAVGAARFIGGGFNEARLYNETLAGLRYAQSAALAMQRTVCVTFTATSLTLTYASAYGSSACNTNLTALAAGVGPYTVTAQGSATFAPAPAALSFDRVGRPNAAQTISIANYSPSITVEAESGYVH